MPSSRLDPWLPRAAIRTYHRRASTADADELWQAAVALRLSDTRALGRLVRWRIPGTAADQSFGELLRAYPFTVLEEDRNLLISGLCGRIWTLARDYPAPRRLCGLSRLARGRHRARGLRALDRTVPRRPGGVGLGGSRAAGRPRCSASLTRALEDGRPVRSPRGCGGAHGGRASGGGEPRSRDGSPSSRPASGETASMSICRPRSTRRRSRPASTC